MILLMHDLNHLKCKAACFLYNKQFSC